MRKIRLWYHEGLWRIQFYRQIQDRHGNLVDVWESHRSNGRVKYFETEQSARQYMREGRKTYGHGRETAE